MATSNEVNYLKLKNWIKYFIGQISDLKKHLEKLASTTSVNGDEEGIACARLILSSFYGISVTLGDLLKTTLKNEYGAKFKRNNVMNVALMRKVFLDVTANHPSLEQLSANITNPKGHERFLRYKDKMQKLIKVMQSFMKGIEKFPFKICRLQVTGSLTDGVIELRQSLKEISGETCMHLLFHFKISCAY